MAYDSNLQPALAAALCSPTLAAQIFNSLVSPGFDPGNAIYTAAGNVVMTAGQKIAIINKTVGAATTVTLPPSPATYQRVLIKDGKGDAATNNITVQAAAGNIDGLASIIIAINFGSLELVYNGTQWNVVGSIPLPAAKFSTINVTAGTLAAGNASGAAFTSLTSTNAVPGAQAMRTPAQILADTPGLLVSGSYTLRVTNTGAGTLTLATDSGAGFTMTGPMTVPVNTYSDFVVTINTATTGTVQQVASGPATQPLPAAQFNSINVTTGTLGAGKASGAAITYLMSTNATPGAQAMRTPAQILADTPSLAVGQSYTLRVTNTGAGVFTLATDSGAGFTMTGTMTVAQNTWRDFAVTMNSATTGTVQSVGIGTYS